MIEHTYINKAFLDCFYSCNIDFDQIKDSYFMVTGATGLVGKMLIKGLCILNNKCRANIKIIALVHNEEKANQIFKNEINDGSVKIHSCDLLYPLDINDKVDYIIHCAAITQSKKFIENPVEVINTNIFGTKNILDFANKSSAKSIVYVSSMEVYGFNEDEEVLTEDNIKYLDPLVVRSCYPESKRMSENMCVSYVSEYNLPVKIIRLAQTFGYGADINDTRAFAEFARCAINEKNIQLFTDGKSKRMYLDTIDAVAAIFTVLIVGENGKAYNVANKNTYCSVREMAEFVAKKIGKNKIKVKCILCNDRNGYYPPPHKLFLDTSAIEKLGWHATADLELMYKRLISDMVCN